MVHGVGFKLLNPNKPLPFEDSSFAVVTCLMCLHHVDDQPLMLRELFRVLKPGGMLVIREHDLDDNGMFPVIDIMHGMYDLVWSNPSQNPNFIQEYKAFYRSKTKWRTMASDVGFMVPYPERQPRHYGSYSNAQACNAYFDLFKKPLDASSLQKHFEFRSTTIVVLEIEGVFVEDEEITIERIRIILTEVVILIEGIGNATVAKAFNKTTGDVTVIPLVTRRTKLMEYD
jgi:SAM-dependent methyltransferase